MSFRVASGLLGMVFTIYWGRVLRMAFKSRNKARQSANLVPPEPLGRILRVIWTPAIFLWVIQPWMSAFAERASPPFALRYRSVAISWAAVAWCGAGLALTWICWKKMGRDWRMGIDPNDRSGMISSGPFAIVRHPIYTISQAMMIAAALALPSPALIAAAVIHVALIQWEARREEKYLLLRHGKAYEAYQARVGRFLPRAGERT